MTHAHKPRGQGHDSADGQPREINMTDLAWAKESLGAKPSDSHAAGTPGGGTASGGLAGSNSGDGEPDEDALDAAMGSGILDTAGEEEEEAGYSGSHGGAVGGTPANGRVRGGHTKGGLRPEADRREGTLGGPLEKKEGQP